MPCELTTVVRDPIDRIWSLFHYSRLENTLDEFLDMLESPIEWIGREWISYAKKHRDSILEELELIYARPKCARRDFNISVREVKLALLNEDTPSGLLNFKDRGVVPGHVVANQWDYIDNSVGHSFDIISFEDAKSRFEGRRSMFNVGSYTTRDKESSLTPDIIKRIKQICHKDYENLSAYF